MSGPLHVPELPDDCDALKAALEYAAAGWYVVPVRRGTKNPGSVVGSDWERKSTRDPQEIAAWWAGTDHGIALHCGRSGALVFDVDYPDRVPDVLAAELPAAPHQSTRTDAPGRGHYLFAMPAGRDLGNRTGELGSGWGEVRGRNGVIVVAPSVHPDAVAGGRYQWVRCGTVPALPDAVSGLLPDAGAPAPDIDEGAARAWLAAARSGVPCEPVRAALERGQADIRTRAGSRYEAALSGSRTLVGYAGEGHRGAVAAVTTLGETYCAAVGDERDAAGEWRRMLAGAVAMARQADPTPRQDCDCALWAGEGVGFDPGPFGSEVTAVEPTPETTPENQAQIAELLAEMLTPEQLRTRPKPRPLINGVLDVNTCAWLIGKSGSYKSFVALDWAGHVARGKPWMGRAVRRGPVVYLVAEGAEGMTLRLDAWEKLHGPMENVRFLPRPVQASDVQAWVTLCRACALLAPALIVLDTQARVTVGMEENSNTDMGLFIERVEWLRRITGACVLVVHHIGRSGTDARGASAIDGAQGSELRLERTGDLKATIWMDKQKDMDDQGKIHVELEKVDGGVDPETGRDLSSLAVRPLGPFGPPAAVLPEFLAKLTENRAVVWKVVREVFPDSGGTRAEVYDLVKQRTKAGGREMGKSSFGKAWDHLTGHVPPGDLDERWPVLVPGNTAARFKPNPAIELQELVQDIDRPQ